MAILLINPDFGTVRQTLSPGSRILKMIEPDNSRQIFPAHAKKHYLDAVETIANILKIETFSKDECSDWYDFQENCHPSILEIRQQWEKLPPEEYGDPFGIITFWADICL